MRIFSVEEANALLPTVRRVVADIARVHNNLLEHREAAERAAAGAELGGGYMENGDLYVAILLKINECAARLEAWGVQLKDYGRGLVDFPAMRDGRVVLLCWELGEGDQIEWWHEVEAGYAGRQRL